MKLTDLLLQKWKNADKGGVLVDDERGEETGPNISLSHVIKSFILSLPPVFDMLVTFFYFYFFYCYYCSVLVPQQEHSRSSVLRNITTVILHLNIAIKIMTAGSLRHYAASLLQLCVCRGPLKPSIFIGNVGLYTQTHIFSKCVCGGVLWQLNAFQVFLACWGHRQQPQWRAG